MRELRHTSFVCRTWEGEGGWSGRAQWGAALRWLVGRPACCAMSGPACLGGRGTGGPLELRFPDEGTSAAARPLARGGLARGGQSSSRLAGPGLPPFLLALAHIKPKTPPLLSPFFQRGLIGSFRSSRFFDHLLGFNFKMLSRSFDSRKKI